MKTMVKQPTRRPDVAVILAAAGQSSRFGAGSIKKIFYSLVDLPVWVHAARPLIDSPRTAEVVMVAAREDLPRLEAQAADYFPDCPLTLVEGGDRRAESVRRGVKAIRSQVGLVAIHDAARPCVHPEWYQRVLQAADRRGAAILASPLFGTIKRAGAEMLIEATVPRDGLWQACTPQVFAFDQLISAIEQADDSELTDEAQLFERLKRPVEIIACSGLNVKITTPDDLPLAELAIAWLKQASATPAADNPSNSTTKD
jgi:2-C-methyl-D-erythritol 4-phosphate cytidylyltransferase